MTTWNYRVIFERVDETQLIYQIKEVYYDASGKPMGVLLLNADGSQEFVPLAK